MLQYLEQKLKEIQVQLDQEKKDLDKIYRDRDELYRIKLAAFQTALKTKSDSEELKIFLFQTHFLSFALQERIQAVGARLGIQTQIDSTLIDEMIAEEKENDQKAQDATLRGKEQIEARA